MKNLSLLTALMLSSSMVYAGWITEGYKGDCLEMMCDCVEKDGIGYCCPSGTSFNGKGDAHIEYTPCKCLGANTYYNTTSQKCLSKPTCNPCQKLNVATGTCVADTGKNNQQVQDICHMCQNGKVVLKDENKKIVYNNQCVQCLTDTNCEGETACNSDKTCSCELGTTSYIKLDGKTGCCNTSTHTLSIFTGTQNKVCCPKGAIWDNKEKACVVEVEAQIGTGKETKDISHISAAGPIQLEGFISLTFPQNINSGCWQVLGNSKYAYMYEKVDLRGRFCKPWENDFTLSSGDKINLDKKQISSFKREISCRWRCGGNFADALGQNLYSRIEKNNNKIYVRFGVNTVPDRQFLEIYKYTTNKIKLKQIDCSDVNFSVEKIKTENTIIGYNGGRYTPCANKISLIK